MVNNINDISTPSKVRANFRKYKGNDDAKIELSEKQQERIVRLIVWLKNIIQNTRPTSAKRMVVSLKATIVRTIKL